MSKVTSAFGMVGMVVWLAAACNSSPPRPWLRFQQDGPTNWTQREAGVYGSRAHGAELQLDLNRTQTRVQLVVENRSGAPLELRTGPEGFASRVAIGELLLRPVDGAVAASGPDIMPYNAMQPTTIESGWRGTFFLDEPLGRPPQVGQFFVLTVEVRDAAGACERRTLPLIATNAGTMPAGDR